MFECEELNNGVVRRLSVACSMEMHLVKRVNDTDIFSNKPRPRAPRAPRVTSIRHDNYIRQRH